MKKFIRRRILVGNLPGVIRHKWSDAALQEGVTSIPKQMLRVLARLFPGADGPEQLQVALTLVDYRRPNYNRYPTLDFIAFLSGLDEERFMKRLKELQARGLVHFQLVRNALDFDVHGLLSEVVRLSSTDREVQINSGVPDNGDSIPF
jgi:hypothetical protein